MTFKMPKLALLPALAAVLAAASIMAAAYAEEQGTPDAGPRTETPIKHLIVIIGENRSFDHVFGVYKPRQGETVSNLLSKGIVTEEGKPGPEFGLARQYRASAQPAYFVAAQGKTPYGLLPPPQLEGTPNAPGTKRPPFASIPDGPKPDLAPADMYLLTTGATGLPGTHGTDVRVSDAEKLPNGPFQLTGPNLPYDSYTGDPAHRFYQMWQQSDCSTAHATPDNPAGCLSDLYPYVADSFSTAVQGGTSMAFLNMLQGDAPYLKALASEYTMSDNYHQAEMGGTMVEHFYIAMADNLYYSDGKGHPAAVPDFAIANPNPKSGTDNRYTLDGWFTDCSDASQPGAAPIRSYLASLSYKPDPKCEPGHFYVLNNVRPGYKADGSMEAGEKVLPPSSVRGIGDALNEKGVSFRYYGSGYNAALGGNASLYCNICNPFQYQTSIMADPASRAMHLKDTQDLLADIEAGTLPAVSYVKPDVWTDGHPQTSKLDLFEAFARNIIERVKSKPELFADTAIFLTFDEGGGYYDSGFIQPLDFFGDGPRIPFIVVSPYAAGGRVVHDYADHASVVKFIERNWGLKPLSARSRDNLPNPKADAANPYVPVNSPAIDDLSGMFAFAR